jgi:hypothetical protein
VRAWDRQVRSVSDRPSISHWEASAMLQFPEAGEPSDARANTTCDLSTSSYPRTRPPAHCKLRHRAVELKRELSAKSGLFDRAAENDFSTAGAQRARGDAIIPP